MLACRCRTIQSKRGKKVKDVSKQQKIRMAADMLMVILLPLLMAYSLIGESLHEWFGIVMFAVFFFHHFLNWRWYKNLTKGSYTIRRIVLTITNGLLLMLMIALPVSGMFMAKHTLRFLNGIVPAELLRTVHLLASHWGFILMSLHLGLHWGSILSMMKKMFHIQSPSSRRTWILRAIAIVLCCYGIYSFVALQYGQYLFLRSVFVFLDFSKPLVFSLAERIGVMALFVGIAYYADKIMLRKK